MEIMIDEALDRLLHRRSYLATFLANPRDLELQPDDLEALMVIDRYQLVAAAAAVRQDLVQRNHRGSGCLTDLYPRTIGDRDVEEMVADFMESEEFDAYREIPFVGVGFSLEESFYRYCVARGIGEAEAREHEFLSAMIKALLLSPRADFHIPAAIHRCPRGFFAVGGTMLFAALGEELVTGRITPFLADLLLKDETPESIAERHGVMRPELAVTVDRLVALGLR